MGMAAPQNRHVRNAKASVSPTFTTVQWFLAVGIDWEQEMNFLAAIGALR
jgi:hypothetical protein